MEINNHHHDQLLVVGGAGFIGQHVVKKALTQGFNTTILSKNDCKAIDKLDGVTYLCADIRNKEQLLALLEGKTFDYIINLGGYVDHSKYSNGGDKVFDVHFNGVRNLVNCIDRLSIKSFVQIGSSDEYGDNPAPQFESQKESPISSYSCAKVASTYFLQTLYKTENFPAVILRPFLVYGPGQSEDRFIPQIIKGCKLNDNFSVSHGEQRRDFCYIDDFIRAIFLSLDNDNAYGEVINVASGIPVAIKDVINKIVNIVGSGNPDFGRVPYRFLENMNLYADISKAKKILQWHPDITLDKGISKMIYLNK